MAKIKLLLLMISVIVLLAIIGAILFLVLKPKVGGVFIDTIPVSEVYINGEKKGETPFRSLEVPGEFIVTLKPKDVNIDPYETKLSLLPNVETVLRYSFGQTYEMSSGEIISFEKIGPSETQLAIVTVPDKASITLDSRVVGEAPHKEVSISEGEHTILVSKQGYVSRSIKVKTHTGYILTAVVTLAKGPAVTATPTPSPTPIPEAMIEILSTPTGSLRVRTEPKTGSEEVGEVKQGESFPMLERDTVTGWYKIRLTDGSEGWVSPQYTKRIQNQLITPSITSNISPTIIKNSTGLSPTVALPTASPVIVR